MREIIFLNVLQGLLFIGMRRSREDFEQPPAPSSSSMSLTVRIALKRSMERERYATAAAAATSPRTRQGPKTLDALLGKRALPYTFPRARAR